MATRSAPLNHLDHLEAESIHIIRETAAQFERPVLLYSMGKDSSVIVRLALKAFAPAPLPFPLLHIDTGYDFPEMYAFRDSFVKSIGAKLLVHRNEEAIAEGSSPFKYGTRRCCNLLRTVALLDGIREGGFDAAIGGARREEERSRAKERIFSFRDQHGQWEPRSQRPELWHLYNGKLNRGESIRVFPLSNWTEVDIWSYIEREDIPLVPLYYAAKRKVILRGDQYIGYVPGTTGGEPREGEEVTEMVCRFRTLGCIPCSGAMKSTADTVSGIHREVVAARSSERTSRVMDHEVDGAMELNKREGCF